MPKFDTGKVVEIVSERNGVARLQVKVGRSKRRALAFTTIIGPFKVGDQVLLNTTAVDLKLGTGGDDFVVWNLERSKGSYASSGHIMKLRYTPWQIDTLCAEAPESGHHEAMREAVSLAGMPVVACGLHSQVPVVAALLKQTDPDLKVVYVMTDGAALPIQVSELVAECKEKGVIDGTVTCGHAFGGDLDSVNIFSGLLAACDVLSADVVIVGIGPGVVGTQTMLGHTGMEQGQVISAISALGGKPIATLRVSFADSRERHQGLSHHTIAALRYGTGARCSLPVPDTDIDKLNGIMGQLESNGLSDMHDVRIVDAWETEKALLAFELAPTTMGRGIADDPLFFEAAGAAGIVAGQFIYGS